MTSVASGGPADRITARILVKVPTAARYSCLFFLATLRFVAEPEFAFFIGPSYNYLPIRKNCCMASAIALGAIRTAAWLRPSSERYWAMGSVSVRALAPW